MVKIIQGEDKEINFQIVDEETNELIDLTGATEIRARFQKTDKTILEKKLSVVGEVVIVNGPSGKGKVVLTEADTLLLNPTDKGSIEFVVEKSSLTQIAQAVGSIIVAKRLFT